MPFKNLPPINNDKTINAFIEIPMYSNVKYEYNEDFKIIEVDRFSMTTMGYPCNYGSIHNTLGGDGDPLDVLVLTRFPLIPNCIIKARVIGVLLMTDESGTDEKILCVPMVKADKFYEKIHSYKDLPEIELDKIKHFFERYKDLDHGKWVKIDKWQDENEAMKVIEKSIEKFNSCGK